MLLELAWNKCSSLLMKLLLLYGSNSCTRASAAGAEKEFLNK